MKLLNPPNNEAINQSIKKRRRKFRPVVVDVLCVIHLTDGNFNELIIN